MDIKQLINDLVKVQNHISENEIDEAEEKLEYIISELKLVKEESE